MSHASSSAGAWFTRLDPVAPPELARRPDDPRLGERTEFWKQGEPQLRPGRPILVGFPQDEGVRRNGGRPGAAEASCAIRSWLYRLTPYDGQSDADLDLLDMGNVRIVGDLEQSQQALAEVIASIVSADAIPIVLGGGHETAYGHYLGYVHAARDVAIINFDAHLDVRPCLGDLGHSGSPFRQALEHPTRPLRGDRYVCLGAQPFAVGRKHHSYVLGKGGVIRWCPDVRDRLGSTFTQECQRLAPLTLPSPPLGGEGLGVRGGGCSVYATLDADVVRQADVPGVSAPNPVGLPGEEVAACAMLLGENKAVSSFDLVEINPSLDRDGQSARWAAVVVWHFLTGLTRRSHQ